MSIELFFIVLVVLGIAWGLVVNVAFWYLLIRYIRRKRAEGSRAPPVWVVVVGGVLMYLWFFGYSYTQLFT